jgi:phytoene synthase
LRPAFDALFDIDEAMADVVTRSTEPTLGAIKLAWWRERLEELDEGKVPAEPRLGAAATELLPRGITGTDLAGLEENWALVLRMDDPTTFMRGVAGRGPAIFGLAARLLGLPLDDHLRDAANSFVAADLARRRITEMSPQELRRSTTRSTAQARPLTAFAAIARRDMRSGGPPFEPEASPGRAWALLRHHLTGRY